MMKAFVLGFKKLPRNLLFFSILLLALLISEWARAGQVTLSWDANTEPDLAGYKIHYGTSSRSYSVHIDVQNVRSYTVTGLTDGQTYYFASTAYNASGDESAYSNEVSYSGSGSSGQVLSFTLVNAVTDQDIKTLANGDAINLAETGTSLNIRANVSGSVGSVRFALDGNTGFQLDNTPPYSLAGDSSGDYAAWTPAPGSHSLTATCYSTPDGSGTAGTPLSIGFAVTNAPPNPVPNGAPTADAGADQTVSAGAAVTLRGAGSDPENAVAAYQWRQTGGTLVALKDSTAAQAGFTAPAISTGALNLEFELQVTDAGGLSATDRVSIWVQSADIDGDGVPNDLDAFPNDPKEWRDTDGDRIGDNADPDDNNNGIPDVNEIDPAAPAMPVLVSPINEVVVNPVAVLKAGSFRTPVAGVTHAKSRWQVFREDDDFCVLDIQSNSALTSLRVPKLILDEDTPYFWRVQYIDSKALASPWSDYGYFSTQNTGRDLNPNGIPDAQEVGPKVDLDKDGVKDNQQTTIKSVKMEGTTVQIGVSIKDCPAALAVESVESEAPGQPDSYVPDKPMKMPFGLINFKIAVLKPGDQAIVKLYFSEQAPRNSQWYKYDPIAGQWHDFSANATFAENRRSLTVTLRDGGPGDADGVANGVIVDPAGIVEEADAETAGSESAADGGGCFITASHDAGAAPGDDGGGRWLVIGLIGILGLLLGKGALSGCPIQLSFVKKLLG
jgi:hypothetical protein